MFGNKKTQKGSGRLVVWKAEKSYRNQNTNLLNTNPLEDPTFFGLGFWCSLEVFP